MHKDIEEAIAAIQTDTISGASAIGLKAVGLLRRAAQIGPVELESAARALCAAQPSMAGLRTAAALALNAQDPDDELRRFEWRLRRRTALIARHAASLLLLRQPTKPPAPPLRLVTCSSSGAVETTIAELAGRTALDVCCAESRPGLEGRGLAIRLAAQGISVTSYTDAGISAAVSGADALVIGADAVGPDFFINKVGTGALCARSAAEGVPVYVLAGREKLVTAELFSALELRTYPPEEVWPNAPTHVTVMNSYFEVVSLALISMVVTEAGAIPPSDVAGRI